MLTLAELIAALAPEMSRAEALAAAQGVPLRGVCIDSRQAQADDLFVALRGERTDGHAYVCHAYAQGATVALVERPVEGPASVVDLALGVPPAELRLPVAIQVPNALEALQRLAQARRRAVVQAQLEAGRPPLRVIGVTGSVGKTTTKELIAGVLAQRYNTLKSTGNYNNEIGLPLTLMTLTPEHERAVLEMAMYDLGEIATLCRIAAPHVGVVTNVGPVHLERLGTLERIAQAKAELVAALPAEGVAVLHGDDPRVRAMGAQTQAQVVTFGLTTDNRLWADAITSRGLEGVRFVAHVQADLARSHTLAPACELEVAALGQHMVLAALAAVAVGIVEGLHWDAIRAGVWAAGRGVRLQPKRGLRGVLLLDDTYNASPASVQAALDVLAEMPGRHVAVLGDMLELGAYEEEGHRQVGTYAARTVKALVAVGARGRLIAEGARMAGLSTAAIHRVDDTAAALTLLMDILRAGDTVLVKGSRGMHMETIVQALEERA